MAEVELYNGSKWFLSKKTKANIDILINDLAKSEMDLLILIDGYEGSGKTFMSRGLAMYIATVLRKYFPNTTFGVDDITFTTETYVNQSLEHGEPHKKKAVKINVLDEGRHALNRKSSTSRGNKIFTNFLSECRAMQQVHIILCPAFHDLDRNVVLWRTSAILHAMKSHIPDKESASGFTLKRGKFKLFTNREHIATQYQFPYNYPRWFEDHTIWSSKEVFTPEQLEAYNEKKFKATIQKYKVQNSEEMALAEVGNSESGIVKSHLVAKKMGVSPGALKNMIDRKEIKGRRIGKFWYIDTMEVLTKFGFDFRSKESKLR